MPLYLGLDSSTQSLTAVVIDIDRDNRRVVLETTVGFDEALPHYGTCRGVLPDPSPDVGLAPPLMWAEALDMMMARLVHSGLDLRRIAPVSASAQQHGSVYLAPPATAALGSRDFQRPLADQLRDVFSRDSSPIWTDSTTGEECREITAALGGDVLIARRTGSRVFERFTGAQIRKFFKQSPAAYARTHRIHLVSSF